MSSFKHVQKCLTNVEAHAKLNAFITLADRGILQDRAQNVDDQKGTDGLLKGKLVAVKDNICTSDLPTTAGSYMLKNFKSPYDATVVQRLRDNGAIIAGKTNLDEFGMGSHSTFSHFGAVKNPKNQQTHQASSAGGSSGGSAVAVATDQCWASLGTDTGGSVRLPAAYTGVVGFKPSYGLISRWGVIAYANSLDTVGILAKTTHITRHVFQALNAHDHQDPTSLRPSIRHRIATSPSLLRSPLRIGVPAQYNIHELAPAVRIAWHRTLARLRSLGHTLHAVSLPTTPAALAAYYVLAPAEASSNLAKYDGVRYGTRTSGSGGGGGDAEGGVLYAATRGAGFGPEVRRRIVLGAYTLSAEARGNYFLQAQRVRRKVQDDFDRVLRAANPLRVGGAEPVEAVEEAMSEVVQGAEDGVEEGERVDLLVCPTAPGLPPALESLKGQSPVEAYTNDVFTVPASLAGLPAISVPVSNAAGKSDDRDAFPFVGMQIIGQFGSDELVLDVAQALEEHIAEEQG
ncbi:MAG: Trimeric GatFAB AmidoTransferase(AdT) complex subunit [Bathelium mastoideum]|nr:MAG: Trimeric GatFAB AmidoTransferase(AdT) complex subunit [Bathelium mastoideum]